MRTRVLKESILNRLILQAEEAEQQGLTKIASHLTDQIEAIEEVRDVDDKYIYASKDFKIDVESKLWDIAVLASDFYDKTVDPIEAQNLIERYAEDLLSDLRTRMKVADDVGAHEEVLPGENKLTTEIEVEE